MPRAGLGRYFRHGLFPQLIVFEATARLGSVTRAAEELHLAQPTVSLQLKKLAEALEVPLFEHRGRRLHLTAAGSELLAACADLIGVLARAEAKLAPRRAASAALFFRDARLLDAGGEGANNAAAPLIERGDPRRD